jgi:hypothetical protein
VLAVVGQQLLCVLEWGECLLLALPGRRAVAVSRGRSMSEYPIGPTDSA